MQDLDSDALALAQTIDALDPDSPGVDTPSADHVDPPHPVLAQSFMLRQLTACKDATTCLATFVELAEKEKQMASLTESDCLTLMAAACDRGNTDLAQVLPLTLSSHALFLQA